MYQDKIMQCAACGEGFIWTAGEQEFFASKGFVSPPKSCRGNRQARKAQRDTGRYESNGTGYRPEHCPYGEGASATSNLPPRAHRPRDRFSGPAVDVVSGIVASGEVARLLRDRMFGFIRDDQGTEYYFHESAVSGDFFSLREGMRVSFLTEANARGPRAANVSRLD